jgi:hypothetical protein
MGDARNIGKTASILGEKDWKCRNPEWVVGEYRISEGRRCEKPSVSWVQASFLAR